MPLINEAGQHNESMGAKELWRPSSPQSTQIYDFMTKTSQKYGIPLDTYHDLWKWSVTETSKFWEEIWRYTSVRAHKPYDRVGN